jgi:hypothetical protein
VLDKPVPVSGDFGSGDARIWAEYLNADAPDVRVLARYGKSADVSAEGQPTLTGVNVMPNHRALALRYAISDNFHADGDVSADGHRWLVGIYPNEWMETQVAAAYGGQAGFSMNSPGRRAFFGSNASSIPEDYNEAGSIFDHLARHGIPFRNYGEGFEFPGVDEADDAYPTGGFETLNVPMTKPLFENTSREYPIFNMMIPDQYRATQFLRDLAKFEQARCRCHGSSTSRSRTTTAPACARPTATRTSPPTWPTTTWRSGASSRDSPARSSGRRWSSS